MRFYVLLAVPLFVASIFVVQAFAETQTLSSDIGSLDVRITHDPIKPDDQTRIKIEFINPILQRVQEHIDYTVAVSKDGDHVFGPIPLTHTSPGVVNIPVEFTKGEGTYTMDIEMEGILFQPIPTEVVSFDILVGQADKPAEAPVSPDASTDKPAEAPVSPDASTDKPAEAPVSPDASTQTTDDDDGGGCLIATAVFGSELAPQVQQLRELRDNTVLRTDSGLAFMTAFNQFYYSFSPAVADHVRESPPLKDAMRVILTPMLLSLSLLSHADIDSDGEMLVYGASIILLNIGMYVGIPAVGAQRLSRYRSTR